MTTTDHASSHPALTTFGVEPFDVGYGAAFQPDSDPSLALECPIVEDGGSLMVHDPVPAFDGDHGEPRSPSSLSGGEKFVVSLALALGMVEMMGRQGDRIESLFLDEGFGALDRTNLDTALEALGSVAAKGRMVAVITHLRAVAEQINHVLAVKREPTGLTAQCLEGRDRSALVENDLGATTGSSTERATPLSRITGPVP